jgi:hypothetical protein
MREQIQNHPSDKLITTRELLHHGTRKAVDCAVSVLVKEGTIRRVARGVFEKRERIRPVGIIEIAMVKAQSFGRKLITHAADLAERFGFLKDTNAGNRFETDGRSSSFLFGLVRIKFKGTSPRKIALGNSKIGKLVRALCHMGKDRVNEELIGLATRDLNHVERAEIGRLCSSMPSWLSDYFASWTLFEKTDRIKITMITDRSSNSVMESSVQYLLRQIVRSNE